MYDTVLDELAEYRALMHHHGRMGQEKKRQADKLLQEARRHEQRADEEREKITKLESASTGDGAT